MNKGSKVSFTLGILICDHVNEFLQDEFKSYLKMFDSLFSQIDGDFDGLGMPVSQPSLGSLIKSGFDYIFSGSWWITLFPGIALVVLILSINLLGDWVRDFLNPKLYKE